ncbi:hypothetical protein [Roseibium aggregatum]|uniref:Uncharacterized protein n=1 Tax=Roseibium aggregatum TaxID=187304 RepID=A0A939EA44_9HYPH|nr:hypothetical protein [Roseibium aggregatum]MBN9669395.1 hypothetical protein [Roseibium aggregatum]
MSHLTGFSGFSARSVTRRDAGYRQRRATKSTDVKPESIEHPKLTVSSAVEHRAFARTHDALAERPEKPAR